MKSFSKFYEEMTGTSAVPGAGDDSSTVVVRKKPAVRKRKGWSDKYKKSIDCDNPKGFSQKAHCAGRDK